MRVTTLTFFCVLFLVLLCGVPASAGPLFPCPSAVSSKNGSFLVLSDVQIHTSPGNTAPVDTATLRVFPKLTFINSGQRINAPATYWAYGPEWSVVLEGSQIFHGPDCLVPLITDDGEFLILLSTGAAFDNFPVLRIYRRRDHLGDPMREGPDHGVFIKEIALKEIWPADKLSESWNDHTPEWFAEGTFDFSPDSRMLIHQTRWSTTVLINLADGSISQHPFSPAVGRGAASAKRQ